MRNDFDVQKHFNPEFQMRKRIVIDAREENPLVVDLADKVRQKIQGSEGTLAVDSFFGVVIPHAQSYNKAGFSTSIRIDGNEYYFPYYGCLKIDESIARLEDEELNESHHDVTDVPLLEINDSVEFCKKLVELENVVNERKDLPWFASDEPHIFSGRVNLPDIFSRIWYSATPYDFQNPMQFLNRIIAFTIDKSLSSFREERDFGSLSALKRNLVVRQTEMPSKFDAPFALDINIRTNNAEEHSGVLPQVIYGIDSRNGRQVVYIQAVQMPKIKTLDEEQLKKNKELLNILVESNIRNIKTFVTDYPDIFQKHFGDLPKEIIHMGNPVEFVKAFYTHLRQTKPEFFDEKGRIKKEELLNIAKSYLDGNLEAFSGIREMAGIYSTVEKINTIISSERDILERKKLLRSMYRLDADLKTQPVPAGLDRSEEDRIIGENGYIQDLKEVFRPAIVSLTAALAVFQKEGFHELAVPVYTPLRWQHHVSTSGVKESERIHRNINEGLVRLFNRVAFHVSGIETQTVSDEDGFFRIRLTDKLKSDNQMLQEVITQIDQ